MNRVGRFLLSNSIYHNGKWKTTAYTEGEDQRFLPFRAVPARQRAFAPSKGEQQSKKAGFVRTRPFSQCC